MADLAENVDAEVENIRRVLDELSGIEDIHALSRLELAGTGALLSSLYNGFENILKQIVVHRGEDLPSGPSWHRDLLEKAGFLGIVSAPMKQRLRQYAAFRHFFGHAYAMQLDAQRIEPLIAEVGAVTQTFIDDVVRVVERDQL